jgi:hypothetical protein
MRCGKGAMASAGSLYIPEERMKKKPFIRGTKENCGNAEKAAKGNGANEKGKREDGQAAGQGTEKGGSVRSTR